MSLPTREGRFKARIVEHGVEETGDNHLLTFVVKVAIEQELVGGEWYGFEQEETGWEITGYFYLLKKDGDKNEITIKNLMAAFGWDGIDPAWLQTEPLKDRMVQVKLQSESWNGKDRIKVQYIDNEDGGNMGVKRATPDRLAALSAKFKSKPGGPKPGGINTRPTTPRPAPPPAPPRPMQMAPPSFPPPASVLAAQVKEDAPAAEELPPI